MRHPFAALLLICPLVSQQPEELFDGHSLAGWHGDEAVWRVEDGCITGSTVGLEKRRTTYLFWEGGEIADFELSYDIRIEGDNNSGVQYRSRELPNFDVAGYQCDAHPTPDYVGMFYEEKGAGVLCRRGQFLARDAEGEVRVVGRIGTPQPIDLSRWHTFRVVATGGLMQHFVDGVPAAILMDDLRTAPRQGVIALQVHQGAEMTVRFKNLRLMRLPVQEMAKLPPLVTALLAREKPGSGGARGQTPRWIWDAEATAEEDVFFRRRFTIDAEPAAGQVRFTCDNGCRVYLNGRRVGAADDWSTARTFDVGDLLRQGDNVIAVHGWNEGGPAAMVLRLIWEAGGQRAELVTDASWRCSNDDPDGWNDPDFDDGDWQAATDHGALGAAGGTWSGSMKVDALDGGAEPGAPQVALPAEGLSGPGADRAVQLLEVPRAYGSWVAMCADDKGRLYASDQSRGLYRITPAAGIGGLSVIEKVEVELDGAQGLCWFDGALYAVVSVRSPGLYRLRDSDGDDRLDRVELLRELKGGGEHGPHAIVRAPDGENLLVLIGNHVPLTAVAAGLPAVPWGEGRLLPKMEDPRGHASGLKAPGGYICKVDPTGTRWELLCWGFRNSYDVAVLPGGDCYVYDADMEWDMGLPWYRPTRILKVIPGADYGWRSGSNKWSADYPDSPPSVCDIGPGSPTGMVVHGDSVLALDWTFGTIYELPIGSSMPRPFVTGIPLPLTDAVSVGEHLYVLTGGRGLPSRLLDLGPPPPPAAELVQARHASVRRELREVLARLGEAVDASHPAAADDRHWQLLTRLAADVPFAGLAQADRIAWLRIHALVLQRMASLSDERRTALAARLLALFPAGDDRTDQDLAELLAFLDAPGLLDKAVPLLTPLRPAAPPPWAEVASRNASYGGAIQAMLANMPPTGQIAIAYALRTVKHGWTLAQRRALFQFFHAARQCKGGASYDGYLKAMVDEAWDTCSAAEQQALADIADKAKAELPKFQSRKPIGPGRSWQLDAAKALVQDGLDGRDLASGHNLFHAAGCASCHYFAGEGGNHGPDLTSLGNKFTAADVLESILEPSLVISDQYSGSVVHRRDGTTVFGRATQVQLEGADYWEIVPAVADAVPLRVAAAEVEKVEPSPLSPMPRGLVDALNPEELRDLLAFLLSRGVAVDSHR
ncbi:MAG: DUF1080 domain-containing protein [Planctomycetes bacterium]|nr:DUF1080 domain-containing protein [Planctomycetota bacterium]